MAIRIVQVNVMKYILHIEIADPDQEAMEESKRVFSKEVDEEC